MPQRIMQKKYNVLYPLTGGDMGGSHVALQLLFRHLTNKFNPVLLLDHHGKFADTLKQNKEDFFVEPLLKSTHGKFSFYEKLKKNIATQLALRKFLKKHTIDLIHVSDSPLPLFFLAAGFINKVPVIWHHHNHLSGSRLEKLMAFFSKKNIFVSSYLKNLCPSLNGPVIYNPIACRNPHQKNSKQHPQERLSIGFVGNLYYRKRPFVLLQALSILKTEGINFNAAFYGDEREISFQELKGKIEDYNLKSYVTIYKFIPNQDNIFSKLDLVVCPAIKEPFGRVLIEAMNYKVLVIASNTGGHKEIIQDNVTGLFFEPDSPKDLANKIKKIIEDSELRSSIVEQAYKKVSSYNIDNHVKKMEDYYLSVLPPCT